MKNKMEILCKETCCEFNNERVCTRKNIIVGSGTDCESFKKDPNKKADPKKDPFVTMFTEPPRRRGIANKFATVITCDANCCFNNSHLCNSNGLTVADKRNTAVCCSFLKGDHKKTKTKKI